MAEPARFGWMDLAGKSQSMELPADSLAYSCCQVPIVLQLSEDPRIEVWRVDGEVESIAGSVLDPENSRHIFQRDGHIHQVRVFLNRNNR